ncbi:alpha/beta fold hydrolase [Bacillus sp. 2205SS5-2]|uniref:alpha/beta fold hydrolase n=1 Tax=Bacillus sp. 2205SS5-2 TaxID=3109031 RepID=UPI00300449DB
MPVCKVKDLMMYYDDVGKGTPIVWVHPPGLGRKIFYQQYPLKARYRLLLPDLGGHGDSGGQQLFTIDDYVHQITALIQRLSLHSCYLCGYSAGGIIAQEVGKKIPEKIAGIILLGGYPVVEDKRLKVMHKLGMYMTKHQPNKLITILAKVHSTNAAIKKELEEHMKKAFLPNWMYYYEQSYHYDGRNTLDQLPSPLLLIYGKKSDWINNQSHYYNHLLYAQYEFINKGTHEIPSKFPGPCNEAIQQFVPRKKGTGDSCTQ